MTTLDPDLLLRAYAVGVFPMADSRDAPDVFWVEPKRRGILPLNSFHLSHSLAKALKSDRFTVTADKAFADVMRGCAEPKPDRPETWINELIIDLQSKLNVTSVVVTHDIQSAFSVGDRIAFLNQGVFEWTGTMEAARNADHPLLRDFLKSSAVVAAQPTR